MNSRQRRKLAAEEHQKQRELLEELRELRQTCYEKFGRSLLTYGLSTEQAIAKYRAVLEGVEPMPRRDRRASMSLASLMAASLGGVA